MWQILIDRVQGKAAVGEKRSNQWRKLRREFLKTHHTCAVCGGKKKIEVHHKVPFNLAPDLELNPNNLIVLCERKKYGINCHLLVGHLGNYRKINPTVDADASWWRRRLGGEV